MPGPIRTQRGDAPAGADRPGPITYMARNGVAANLLMLFILVAGFLSLGTLVQEVFPEVSMDRVLISVPYPGAAPGEVEESIVLKIEEQVKGVEGLKRMTSAASEGAASVVAEVAAGVDPSRFLDDVKARMDRIATFPAGAERPEVTELTNRQSVVRLVVHGDVSERTLKELAHRVEDELAGLPEVSHVETTGVRDYEISIEVPQRRLRALGLTLGDVSRAVRAGSLNLSAGSIDTREEEVRIRTTGQNYTQRDFEEIVVVGRADGTAGAPGRDRRGARRLPRHRPDRPLRGTARGLCRGLPHRRREGRRGHERGRAAPRGAGGPLAPGGGRGGYLEQRRRRSA